VVVLLGLSGWTETAQKPAAKTTHAKKAHAKKAPDQAPIPPYTPRTLQALPLDQMPAVPPEVNFAGGQLKIVARNSTLADVLHAVHKETGAQVDLPPNANERVVAMLGPGSTRDVLVSLLNGTHFNYVMLGSPADPTSVERVVLTQRTGPEAVNTASAAPPPGQPGMPNRFQQPVQVQQAEAEAEPEDNSAEAQDDSNGDNADDQQQADQQQQGEQQQGQQPQAPKTPEQLLQELQRQQQQLQQQQQNGQPGGPVVYPNQPGPGVVPNQQPQN
jgi:hypothetical protein